MAKVLIIDDDSTMRDLYQIIFQLEGHDVSLADSGVKGIEAAKSNKPDVILLDMMMPQMSGPEVLEALKKENDTKDIPTIMFTNLMSTEERDASLALGARAYLVKSEHTPQDIVNIVMELIGVS